MAAFATRPRRAGALTRSGTGAKTETSNCNVDPPLSATIQEPSQRRLSSQLHPTETTGDERGTHVFVLDCT